MSRLAIDAIAALRQGEICSIPGFYISLREPKKKRHDAPHAFRLDVKDSSVIKGSGPTDKLIFDAPDADSKAQWLVNLVRVNQAGTLAKYISDMDRLDTADGAGDWLENPSLPEKAESASSESRSRSPENRAMERWKKISSNERILIKPDGCACSQDSRKLSLPPPSRTPSLSLRSIMKATAPVTHALTTRIHHTGVIECTFSTGPLGIVFEGTDGTDVHVAHINGKSQVSRCVTHTRK